MAQTGHYYLGLTAHVNPILKCPHLSQIEMSRC